MVKKVNLHYFLGSRQTCCLVSSGDHGVHGELRHFPGLPCRLSLRAFRWPSDVSGGLGSDVSGLLLVVLDHIRQDLLQPGQQSWSPGPLLLHRR